MNKRTAIVIFFVLVALAIWSPWLYFKFNIGDLFGVQRAEDIAGLQVNSLAGEVEVYIDGEYKGLSSADRSPFILDRIEPKDYLITLKRKSDVRGSYWVFNRLTSFVPDTTVIMTFNLGPEELFSEGNIIYATLKDSTDSKSKINLQTNVENPEVKIDEEDLQKINSTKFSKEVSLDKQYKLSVKKSGYDPLEVTLLPESEEDRKLLEKYDINIEVYLMLQPVSVE